MESNKNSRDGPAFAVGVSVKAEVGRVAAKGVSRTGEKKRGKYSYEVLQGCEFNVMGQLMKKERIIDRKNNYYKEVIFNTDTNRIVREVSHPLSAHIGHGTAKYKKDPP